MPFRLYQRSHCVALLVIPPTIFTTISLSLPVSAQEQNPLVQTGSIGIKKTSTPKSRYKEVPFVPVEKWVGEKFVFKPLENLDKSRGYDRFHVKGETYSSGKELYAELLGKIAEVVSVTPAKTGEGDYDKGDYDIELIVEETGKSYIGRTAYSRLEGIALVADIEFARKKFIGKTLWFKSLFLNTYNAETDSTSFEMLPKYCKVYVKNVVVSDDDCPCRLIVKTEHGQEGYSDIVLSGTNTDEWRLYSDGIDRDFMEVNPRKLHPWTRKVWEAIERRRVLIGMTEQQVKFALGTPDHINRTKTARGEQEQWVYEVRGIPKRYIYVTGGKVSAIQE